VKDRYLSAGSRDRREGAVGIAEDQDAVGTVIFQRLVDTGQDLPDLLAERARLN
jgi:hypothetical protein